MTNRRKRTLDEKAAYYVEMAAKHGTIRTIRFLVGIIAEFEAMTKTMAKREKQ